MGKVRKSVIYYDKSTGKGNYNATHEKYLYEFEYTDGTTDQLAAYIIAEHMMSQVDFEGNHYQVLTEVTDQKKDDSDIAKVDGFIKSNSGNLHRERTISGWKLLVEWKDVSVDWVTLKYLKQSNPVGMDEHAVEMR